MKKLIIAAVLSTQFVATPAPAHHVDHLGIPYDSRGECEAESARLRNDDREFLMEVIAPDIFVTPGDVNAFLSRAFSCDLNEGDGQWYIGDHRVEVLDSEWFQRRSRN
jgi:hypothetical protein